MATTDSDDDAPGGGRFPFIPLQRALERARNIYDAAGDHPVPIAEVSKLWGYSDKASGWRQTIASLKYYGIINTTGVKVDRKIKLTEAGRRYFLDERPDKHSELHQKFALNPSALHALWNIWHETPPADPIARSTLKVDFHYAEKAATEILAIYKENVAFAGLARNGASSSGVGNPPTPTAEREPAPAEPAAPAAAPIAPTAPAPRSSGKVHIMPGERELTTGMLSNSGASFRLIVSGQIGEKEIDRLIRKLAIDKEILAEADTTEQAAGAGGDPDGVA
jgi:hypothetical protein